MQTGVKTAGANLPSAPQTYTLHQPFAQLVEQFVPKVHAFDAAARFLAASDGAADIAIATAATAPATSNFVVNFIIAEGSPLF